MDTSAAKLSRGLDVAQYAPEDRFAFGKNWSHFLAVLNEDRIRHAERSLQQTLECDDLWVGGYPYEVARPDEVFAFFHKRGFALEGLTMGGGLACNEFVFIRKPSASPAAGDARLRPGDGT